MNDVDSALCDLYERAWPSLHTLLRARPELSNPLLVNRPVSWREEGSEQRLLIVGQQTGPRRWQPDLAIRRNRAHRLAVTELMRRYSAFKADHAAGTSHFWRFLRALETRLGAQGIWTNLNRCDFQGSRPRVVEEQLWAAFPVLREEIKLIRPSIVVFVTGPTYDNLLERRLGAVLTRVDGFMLNALARVESLGLLPRESYRTFHPNFLCRFRARLGTRILRRVAQSTARSGEDPRPRRPVMTATRTSRYYSTSVSGESDG